MLKAFGHKGRSPFLLSRKGSSRALAENYFGLDPEIESKLRKENGSLLDEISLAIIEGIDEIVLTHHGGGCGGYSDKKFLNPQQEEDFQIGDMIMVVMHLFIEFPELKKITGIYFRIEEKKVNESVKVFELNREYLIQIGLIPNIYY
ncbi:MAG: hypothetical protein P1P85_05675 [Patescibacteria group bacterium]|nr:hypothetical protein [Patescibacteria group bacterium]